MFTPSVLVLVLTLRLMIGVNDATDTNVFFSSINASINVRVNAEVQCKWSLNFSRKAFRLLTSVS